MSRPVLSPGLHSTQARLSDCPDSSGLSRPRGTLNNKLTSLLTSHIIRPTFGLKLLGWPSLQHSLPHHNTINAKTCEEERGVFLLSSPCCRWEISCPCTLSTEVTLTVTPAAGQDPTYDSRTSSASNQQIRTKNRQE